ncbi:MAG: serpin family protein [Clostridiaceae bacterium]|jgi:serpin B|nr:serpin family protein [Clostridiaceae bacterium]HOA56247.1 serpin family protein [Clostridiales bacterium]HQD32065.1 serpin family protein [Clostridiales bacterium]
MNEKKEFDAVGDSPGKFVNEGKDANYIKKSNKRQKYVVAAACVLLLLSVIIAVLITGTGNRDSGLVRDVIYPKAYAFDDHDAGMDISEQNPVDDSFLTTLEEFSYNTGSLVLTDKGININYSPLSLYYALSVAASGAGGDTRAQLLALLGVSEPRVLEEQCGNLYRRVYRDNEIGKLKIANSIWMDNDMNGEPVSFKDSFVKSAAANFYASCHSVDFSENKTGKAMAEWVSANTNGTLSPAIEIYPEQILSILNTVYFYDQWIDRFNRSKTAEDTFYLSNGKEIKVDFMNKTNPTTGFSRGESFTRSGLTLKNAGRMVFILPDEGVSPYDLLASPERMKETFEGGESFYGEVVWKIPKFSFGSKLALTDVLKSLGVSSAFLPDADFSGITDHMAFITDVLQQTHIAIDEDGVEASAFTQIAYAGAALPEGRAEMILNRPFIYYITAPDGSLLFVGVCENPAER